MSSEEDKAKIVNAMGGKKGLLDSGLPALIFLIIFNVTKEVQQAAYGALALSLILTIIRLAKRETIQHAISGVIGVAVCAWLSNRSGKQRTFICQGCGLMQSMARFILYRSLRVGRSLA